ncbi:MAG: GHMP kinase, partial [Thermoproteota archaeon]|nr:GHMP kinase [Thermoproteota archaeon]
MAVRKMRDAKAFSPAHITGFFQIQNRSENLLVKGSRGAGVSIKNGVTTTVCVEKASKSLLNMRINGQPTKSAKVSEQVMHMFLSRLEGDYKIFVNHDVQVPVGAGFGSSGAGALSLALALNEALELGLSRIEVGQIAHIAEIDCKTGLGTVIAEFFGGLEIRMKPGAPGVGEVKHITVNEEYVVACLNFGPLPTSKFLSDQKFCRQINEFGGKLVDEIVKKPDVHNFVKFSRSFAENLGLISTRIRKVLRETDKAGITCSIPMFGESVFSLVRWD